LEADRTKARHLDLPRMRAIHHRSPSSGVRRFHQKGDTAGIPLRGRSVAYPVA
jgi:hypothetical protein